MHKLRSQKVKKGALLRLEFVMEGGRPKRGGSGGVESLGWVFGYGLYNRWMGILRTFGNEDWDDYFHPWREPQNKSSME